LIAQREFYSYILKALIISLESEDFIEADIENDIAYTKDIILWFDSLVGVIEE